MTLILSEKDVEEIIVMEDVVSSVEEAFRRQGKGEAHNSMRTRSRGASSVLNVMHSNLAYLGRGGLKAYMSSRAGTKFVLVLFDANDAKPLAVMGADTVGRFRTGAASGVATKYLFGRRSATLAMFGSGKQALTQVLALGTVISLQQVRVWSPTPDHRRAFADRLRKQGFDSSAFDSPAEALEGAEVATAITSSRQPFLTNEMLGNVSHLNLAGGNNPDHAEVAATAVASFDTIVVDDVAQAQVEYGDLIQAAQEELFSWDSAVELGKIVAGRSKSVGRTLFKSGGAALEDVAVASMVYDKAMKSGDRYPDVDLV